jgi:hypothetical protein
MSYLAVVPCVLVKNQGGGVDYHYASVNPFISWLSDEQAERFLAEGFVVKAGDPGSAAVVDGAGDPGAPSKAPAKPAKTASDEKWVEYGVALGHDRDELLALSKPDLLVVLG